VKENGKISPMEEFFIGKEFLKIYMNQSWN
jgi:hypothetical protein